MPSPAATSASWVAYSLAVCAKCGSWSAERSVKVSQSWHDVPGVPQIHGPRAESAQPDGRRAPAGAGQRMAGRYRDVGKILGQQRPAHALRCREGRVRPVVRDHKVHCPLDQGLDGLAGVGLGQLKLQRRMPGCEEPHRWRREPARRRGQTRQHQPAGDRASPGVDVGLRQLGHRQDRAGVRGKQLRGLGEADPAPAALDQRGPRLALQLRQLLRHRRRRHVQLSGGRGNRAVPRDRLQDAKALQVQHLSNPTMCGSLLLTCTTNSRTAD